MEDKLIPRIPCSALALIILLPLAGCALRQDGVRSDTQQLSDATIRDILAHRVDASQAGKVGAVLAIGGSKFSQI